MHKNKFKVFVEEIESEEEDKEERKLCDNNDDATK